MRIVYFGTPSDAVPALQALVASGNDVALVVTQPDRRRGRGSDLTPSPVKQAAEELGLTVATPEKPDEIIDDLRAIGAEVGVVVAYGEILSD
ncbi:MAG: methionyl-tRNA formyltransferase, partial [Actinobacteria bacterium]|nr:methionyl-tRNA formyltransferase [Actinomycetota bacterium]